jgi:cytochrome c
MRILLFSLFLALSSVAVAQDTTLGKGLFQECAACHSTKPGEVMLGPSLAGTYGRKAGSVEGFRYTNALKKSGVVWDEATLDAYIADPQVAIPGGRMPYSGMARPEDRQNLIAYLRTL